jgi:hypothetical protein
VTAVSGRTESPRKAIARRVRTLISSPVPQLLWTQTDPARFDGRPAKAGRYDYDDFEPQAPSLGRKPQAAGPNAYFPSGNANT